MDEKQFIFGVPEGVNETTLHPLGLAAILVFGITLLFVPRRYAIWPMIFTACFIAPAQRIAFLTLNFTLLRIMVVFGMTRILLWGEFRGFRWKPIDSAVLAWTVSGTVLYIALWGTMEAVKNRSGWAYDNLGMYFLFRCVIRDWDDLRGLTWGFVVASVPVATAFLVEKSTAHNLFAFLGGVPAVTVMREGKLRCQGAFAHAILAGCFWASVMPLIAALWWQGLRHKIASVIGLAASLVIVVTCSSSTPVSGLVAGLMGAALFSVRHRMSLVRWTTVGVLVALQVAMKHPIWYLFAKIDFVGGSTGWHRYWLTDLAIRNFGDWYVMGTQSFAAWDPNADFLDVTNQYIWEGLNGGFLTLLFFVVAIVLCFQSVGTLWRSVASGPGRLAMAWALGLCLLVHCVNFLGVSYFGQIIMLWFLVLAMIASLAPLRPSSVRAAPLFRGDLQAAKPPQLC